MSGESARCEVLIERDGRVRRGLEAEMKLVKSGEDTDDELTVPTSGELVVHHEIARLGSRGVVGVVRESRAGPGQGRVLQQSRRELAVHVPIDTVDARLELERSGLQLDADSIGSAGNEVRSEVHAQV